MSEMNISTFAKLTETPIDTLKYYDRVDLLKPHRVDKSNSYRYYSPDQAITLSKIKYLRALDISIPKIKEYLTNLDIDISIDLVNDRINALDRMICEYEVQKSILLRRRYYLKLAKNAKQKIDSLDLNLMGDRYYYSLGKIDETYEDVAKTFLEMSSTLSDDNILPFFRQYGFVIPKIDLMAGKHIEQCICFIFVEENYLKEIPQIMKAPAGYYLCGYHKGAVFNRKELLDRMLEYIHSRGYVVNGDALQIKLTDEDETTRENDYMYQIQIPVTLKD